MFEEKLNCGSRTGRAKDTMNRRRIIFYSILLRFDFKLQG